MLIWCTKCILHNTHKRVWGRYPITKPYSSTLNGIKTINSPTSVQWRLLVFVTLRFLNCKKCGPIFHNNWRYVALEEH